MSDPPRKPPGPSDHEVELAVSNLLRTGLILATGIVLAGAMVYLCRHGMEAPHYGVFHGEPSDLRRIGGIFADMFEMRGRGFIQFGLVLLLLTPIARVAFSLLAFTRQHDWTYAVVTTIVLGVLLYSVIGGYL